jgi:hypothetical protein
MKSFATAASTMKSFATAAPTMGAPCPAFGTWVSTSEIPLHSTQDVTPVCLCFLGLAQSFSPVCLCFSRLAQDFTPVCLCFSGLAQGFSPAKNTQTRRGFSPGPFARHPIHAVLSHERTITSDTHAEEIAFASRYPRLQPWASQASGQRGALAPGVRSSPTPTISGEICRQNRT